jgi:Ca2+-binding EF-hand superfamily protein
VQNGDENDIAKDPAGYFGNFHRVKHQLEPISEQDFLNVFIEDNKMQKIMNLIRFIDKDKNGFITTSEMTDILKETYPARL